ncbi:hypothetical protein Tam10B_1480 [Bifidobacterium vansinderenii]|uniref:Uncharacterized protein n=1 Tax=Bifidobacterium vansinderenii TaxID=1984871 RepID=A0A229VXC2_9BIFI|nr:hypothetical protein Tam10B_1480 [Bifidobacterium vansinderenii]
MTNVMTEGGIEHQPVRDPSLSHTVWCDSSLPWREHLKSGLFVAVLAEKLRVLGSVAVQTGEEIIPPGDERP